MRVLVCGYGNPYRTDDGAGHVLAPLLARRLESGGHEIDLRLEHQLLPELAADFDGFDLLVFADARVPGTCPGEGFVIEEVRPDSELEGLNIHSAGPEWVLALAARIGATPPKAILVSVEGESFDFGDEPTTACSARIGRATSGFEEWLAKRQDIFE